VLQQNQFYTELQVKPAQVYAQIEADLDAAIPNLPATVDVSTDGGRATKGAAQALLGKAIIYENNTARMTEAAAHLDSVNTSPNYSLLPNFGDIFIPTNKFNSESVFEIVHTNSAGLTWSNFNDDVGNVGVQMVGARSYSGPVYESNTAGYGFNPVTLDLVAAMKNDPRYPYTIVNMDSLVTAGYCSYDKTGYLNTGYFVAKFAPLAAYQSTTGVIPLNWTNDEIEIRLADTYLLEAEALVRGGGSHLRARRPRTIWMLYGHGWGCLLCRRRFPISITSGGWNWRRKVHVSSTWCGRDRRLLCWRRRDSRPIRTKCCLFRCRS
jgi:hypothetical protein